MNLFNVSWKIFPSVWFILENTFPPYFTVAFWVAGLCSFPLPSQKSSTVFFNFHEILKKSVLIIKLFSYFQENSDFVEVAQWQKIKNNLKKTKILFRHIIRQDFICSGHNGSSFSALVAAVKWTILNHMDKLFECFRKSVKKTSNESQGGENNSHSCKKKLSPKKWTKQIPCSVGLKPR